MTVLVLVILNINIHGSAVFFNYMANIFQAQPMIKRIVFVILSTLTPIPFSTVCMAAGAVRLSSRKVLPCCLFRILRMGIYYFLFRAGLVLS